MKVTRIRYFNKQGLIINQEHRDVPSHLPYEGEIVTLLDKNFKVIHTSHFLSYWHVFIAECLNPQPKNDIKVKTCPDCGKPLCDFGCGDYCNHCHKYPKQKKDETNGKGMAGFTEHGGLS